MFEGRVQSTTSLWFFCRQTGSGHVPFVLSISWLTVSAVVTASTSSRVCSSGSAGEIVVA